MSGNIQKAYTRVFSVFLFCIGLSAVAGGYGLIFLDGLGMPAASLRGMFDSFTYPGLILTFIVGGTHISAAILLWRQARLAREAAAVAGFGLLIWVFTELYIIREGHWLQILYFGFAVAILVATMISFKLQKQVHT